MLYAEPKKTHNSFKTLFYMFDGESLSDTINRILHVLGPLAQSVASPTTDPRVVSLIPARSHTFMEIDREIICKAILLLPLIQEGLLSVTSESMCTKD